MMGVTKGQTTRNYADSVDNARILRAEKTAEAICRETRTLRRALKASENDNFEETKKESAALFIMAFTLSRSFQILQNQVIAYTDGSSDTDLDDIDKVGA
ncbi:hypothetical protein TNCT_274311 [Trichonephila clavata]|uniref:Uncharacterized protein n=1 Tax=Trichonephila clavata TaxID=2740835 RepID=A0A8X6M3T0_TRICU|nr:hypothetical protein TNCT_274311 [Trichonephila clavata]